MQTRKDWPPPLPRYAAYIQTEEEALVMPPPARPEPRRFEQGNLWGLSGRQGMMQMRGLMQMKTFNRLR